MTSETAAGRLARLSASRAEAGATAAGAGQVRGTNKGPRQATSSPAPGGEGARPTTGLRINGRRFELSPHNCFACGELNTHGLQLRLHGNEERCWTELALPNRFEGWEGIAHGGILCTILDEVMAWALVDHDVWGLTARLAVDFKRPVPVDVPIRAEGWITRNRRRLIHTAGHILDVRTGEVLATAEAVYVAAPAERKRELKDRYRFRLVADNTDPAPPDEPDRVDPSRAARPQAVETTATRRSRTTR